MIIWSWNHRQLDQESRDNCLGIQDKYEVGWSLLEVLLFRGDMRLVMNNEAVLSHRNVTSSLESLLKNWHLLDFASIESPVQKSH